jgi:tetratricopeptide (TPR) repeat protein
MDYYGPMVPFLRTLAVLLASVAASGSVQSAPLHAAPAPDAVPVASSVSAALLDATLFYEILLGEILISNGDPGAGYSLLLEAARRSNDEKLYQRATDIALQSRSGDAALAAAQAWKEAWPRSQEANRYVLQILIALQRVDETAVPLRQAIDNTPTPGKVEAVMSIPQLFRRTSDAVRAAAVIEQTLSPELTSPATGPAAWTTIGRMRLMAKDPAGALEAALRAQEMDPENEGPALLGLELLEGGTSQAENVLQRYLQGKPKPEIRMAYVRQLLELQRYPEAQLQLQIVTSEKPDLIQAWLVQAALQLQEGKLEDAEASLQQLIRLSAQSPESEASRASVTQAYLLQAQIAEKRGDFSGAEQWLSRIDNEKDLFSAQTRRASLLARQGKLAQGRALLRSLPAATEDARRLNLQAEVQLLREARAYKDAYALQEQLVAQKPGDDDLEYELAMLAEKIGRHATMERLLRQIIARNPNYHHAFNALGYSLADRGIQLTEAKTLITQALVFAPNDPFITDSLAWVEFRLGNLEEARRLLEKAYSIRPDVEIAAHLGEVLWTMGDKQRARALWKESQRLNGDNEVLRETLKRLGVKL